MIETREVRKLFTGPPEVTATLVHQARVLLGTLKNDMAFNELSQGERRIEIPIDQRLLSYSDSPERTIEVRAAGIAVVTAGSIFGQDWIAIDASDVTITVIPPPPKEELYIPYLWVGVRTESARGPFTDCFSEWGYNNAMLHVFEPVTPEIVADIKASEDEELGFDYMASSSRYKNNRLLIGIDTASSSFTKNFTDVFYEEVHYERKTPLEVYYSNNNLYQVGHGMASLLSDGYPDTLWQKAVILDPDDPTKTITETGSYEHHNETFPPHAVPSPQEWQLRGKVVPGQYVVKVQINGLDDGAADPNTYGGVCGPEMDVIVRVKIGKPPGRVETQEVHIKFDKYQWSDFNRDTDPGGNNAQFSPEPEEYSNGPNPHGPSWWQGAFKVDVQNGFIFLTKDKPTVPDWGFDVASHPTVKLISWHWEVFETWNLAGFGIDVEQDGDDTWRGKVVVGTGNLSPASNFPFLGGSVEVTGCLTGKTVSVPFPSDGIDVTGWVGGQPSAQMYWPGLLDGWCPGGSAETGWSEAGFIYTALYPTNFRQTYQPEYQFVSVDAAAEAQAGIHSCASGPAPTAHNIRLTCPRS